MSAIRPLQRQALEHGCILLHLFMEGVPFLSASAMSHVSCQRPIYSRYHKQSRTDICVVAPGTNGQKRCRLVWAGVSNWLDATTHPCAACVTFPRCAAIVARSQSRPGLWSVSLGPTTRLASPQTAKHRHRERGCRCGGTMRRGGREYCSATHVCPTPPYQVVGNPPVTSRLLECQETVTPSCPLLRRLPDSNSRPANQRWAIARGARRDRSSGASVRALDVDHAVASEGGMRPLCVMAYPGPLATVAGQGSESKLDGDMLCNLGSVPVQIGVCSVRKSVRGQQARTASMSDCHSGRSLPRMFDAPFPHGGERRPTALACCCCSLSLPPPLPLTTLSGPASQPGSFSPLPWMAKPAGVSVAGCIRGGEGEGRGRRERGA